MVRLQFSPEEPIFLGRSGERLLDRHPHDYRAHGPQDDPNDNEPTSRGVQVGCGRAIGQL
jgi:hypothetical protein